MSGWPWEVRLHFPRRMHVLLAACSCRSYSPKEPCGHVLEAVSYHSGRKPVYIEFRDFRRGETLNPFDWRDLALHDAGEPYRRWSPPLESA